MINELEALIAQFPEADVISVPVPLLKELLGAAKKLIAIEKADQAPVET